MRYGSLGAVIVTVWLIIGVIAAGQRGYFSNSAGNCAAVGTTVVTIVTGPLNYIAGVNPRVNCTNPHPAT